MIDRVDTLLHASEGAISFLANNKYRKHLATTRASAVILAPEFLAECSTNALVSDNPYLTYAHVAALLSPEAKFAAGRHPSSVVAVSAHVAADAWIGPAAIIEDGAVIGPGSYVGPGCIVGRDSQLGEGCCLVANVTICHGVQIGDRVLIHPGAVIGSDGFGLANDQGRWIKVPQLGGVRIGDDVEIGANTTIDRGAVDDTVLENGVKLDNQIQVAHNVHIGENTAIAACVGIAGSTRIGRNCTLAGGVGVVGHLEIGDNVHFSAQTLVTRSFTEPGYYSGNLPAVPNSIWRRTIARIRRLEDMARSLSKLERRLGTGKTDDD